MYDYSYRDEEYHNEMPFIRDPEFLLKFQINRNDTLLPPFLIRFENRLTKRLMNAYPRMNVLYVEIHGLHQITGKKAYSVEPYFKVCIVGDKDAKEMTAVGKPNAKRRAFSWTDVLQFPFSSNRPPTELLLMVKRERFMRRSRTIATAKVPLYRLGDLLRFTIRQNVIDSKRRPRGVVELTVWIGGAQSSLPRVNTLPHTPSIYPHLETSLYSQEDTFSPISASWSPSGRFFGPDENLGLTLSSSTSGQTIFAMDSEGSQPSKQLTRTTTGVYGQVPGGYHDIMALVAKPGPITQIIPHTSLRAPAEQSSGPSRRYPSIVDDGSSLHELLSNDHPDT